MPSRTPGDDDIVYMAYVDDQTIEFFERFDRNVARTADAAERGFANVEESIGQAGTVGGLIAGVVGGITTKIIELGLQGVAALKGFIQVSVELRARNDVLATVLETVAQRMGYTAEETTAAEESIRSMGITTAAARNSLLLMSRANIDWAEASKLARIAQDAAVVAGINSSDAFERLIRGIQKQEPELLDELGIQLRREDAYSRLAASIGKTTKELTEAEKSQAILNEIYRQAGTVAGSYEAAMGDVGKQMTSLPRLMEDIQDALGAAFQPALQAKVQFTTERLKEMQKWLDENEEQLLKFGQRLGTAAEMIYGMLEKTLDFATKLPGGIEKAGLTLAQIINNIFKITDEDVSTNVDAWKTSFLQLFAILAGGMRGVLSAVVESLKVLMETAGVAVEFLSGGDWQGQLQTAIDAAQGLTDTVINEVAAGFDNASVALGLTGDTAEDTAGDLEDVGDAATGAAEDVVDASGKMREALQKVTDTFQKMQKERERSGEDQALAESRRLLVEQLQNRFTMLDIDQRYSERVTQLWHDMNQARIQLAADAADQEESINQQRADRIENIEERHTERLREIDENFHRDAGELARGRDAIGLLRLMRQRQEEVSQADQDHERDVREAEENYARQMAALQVSIAERERELEEAYATGMQAARDAHFQEYEQMEQQLDRERQLRELHAGFEEEDRAIKFRRELEDLGEQFASIEGLTAEGLAGLIDQWDDYFGDLTDLWESYNEEIAELAAEQASPTLGTGTGVGGSTPGMTDEPTYPELPPEMRFMEDMSLDALREFAKQLGLAANDDALGRLMLMTAGEIMELIRQAVESGAVTLPSTPIGQAGQMSMQLAQIGTNLANSTLFSLPSRLMPAAPQNVVGRQELRVSVDAPMLDPYVQRLLVNGMIEVYKNRV